MTGPIQPSGDSTVESEAFPFAGNGVGDDPALLTQFQNEGLIFAVNRLVLHNLGWALGVSGTGTVENFTASGLALFRTDDPEGIVYDNPIASDVRGVRALAKAGYTDLIDQVAKLESPDVGDPERDGMKPRHAGLLEVHEALVDVGMDGAITAESIVDRIKRLGRGGVGP